MRKNNFFFLVSTVLLLAIVLSSCGDQAYYDDVYSFQDESWGKEDTARFDVPVDDTSNRFQFSLSLRTTTEYEFSNLWVYVLSTAPDGTTSKVAQKLPLARPDGSWIGTVSGTVVQTEVKFAAKHFPLTGEYTFELVNATQQETIENVLDIGLRIKK